MRGAELYQHPPQAHHLSSVLQKLSSSNSQVIVCTHSPYFVSGRGFEDVRILRQEVIDTQPCVRYTTFDELSKSLQLLAERAQSYPKEWSSKSSRQFSLDSVRCSLQMSSSLWKVKRTSGTSPHISL